MNRALLEGLLSRRSVAPKRLRPPGPGPEELEQIVAAALAAPNHGDVWPWRFVLIAEEGRERLADIFVEAKRRRAASADAEALARERDKALNAPTLLVVSARIDAAGPVPPREQWVATGAAIHGALLAAHALGYGAMILSGDKTEDPLVRSALGVGADEALVGFIGIGRIAVEPPPRPRPAVADVLTAWRGP